MNTESMQLREVETWDHGGRFVQQAIDLIEEGNPEAASRLLWEKEGDAIPLLSFWAYRQIGRARAGIAGGYGKEQILECLYRGLYLAQELGTYGEICMVCLNKHDVGEERARAAELQLLDQSGQEPIPVCKRHIAAAADQWRMHPFTEEPVGRLWPPWSLVDTWSLRRPDMFSHERFFYACLQKAVGGDRDAMFYVAMCYELGMGADRSEEAAAVWYQGAAERGYPGAETGKERVERRGPYEQPKSRWHY